MRIRSITCFSHPEAVGRSGEFLQRARQIYTGAGYEVQTLRLATPPFETWMESLAPDQAAAAALHLERQAVENGIAYVSLGPAQPESPAARQAVVPMLQATQGIFCSGLVGDARRGVYLPAVRGCAEIIQAASSITPDGFANLRFTAMANVNAGSPFFPAAYASSGPDQFSLAIEGADLAVEAFSQADSLEQASRKLVEAIEMYASSLEQAADALATPDGPRFGGLDFTLGTFPVDNISIGTALERLGIPAVGMSGSLAAAALITSCIDQAHFKRTGFSGLMLPVLEDSVLARRAADGSLSITDLLLYSAVCGTGLDTIPLPGASSVGQLAALLLDLAALACRLDKPLTARLMPVPGKGAGQDTGFAFNFFANSKVMPLKVGELGGLLTGEDWLPVSPRGMLRSAE